MTLLPRSIAVASLASALTLFCASLGVQAATTVFDTFGPGNSYDASIGWTIADTGSSMGIYQAIAVPFTPGVSAPLETISVATFKSGGTDQYDLTLLGDNGGVPDASAVLESFPPATLSGGLSLFTSTGQPLLQAGYQYWVAMTPGASDTLGGWAYNDQGVVGTFGVDPGYGWFAVPGQTLPAVRVTVVPEPAACAALAGLGLVGFGAYRRLRF